MELLFKNGQIIVLDSETMDFGDTTPLPESINAFIQKKHKHVKSRYRYSRPECINLLSDPISVSKKAYLFYPEIIDSIGAKCVADLGFRHYVSYGKDLLDSVNKAWIKMRELGYKVRLPIGFSFDFPFPNNTKVIYQQPI